MNKRLRLNPVSLEVLKLIAQGYSYSQIVDGHPELTYFDIFFAAEEAVWLDEQLAAGASRESDSGDQEDLHAMARAKRMYPRAYQPWTEDEDSELASMFAEGVSRKEIAARLQRQPSAITSRLRKQGLL